MKLPSPLLYACAAMTGALLIGGCSDSDNAGTSVRRDGQAMDGYLLRAQVCADSDFDRLCERREDDTTTSADPEDEGSFSFSTRDPEAPLVVRAVADTTIDADSITDETPSGQPLSQSQIFDLTAPPRAEVVTPLTTLVQVRAEQKAANTSAASREALVAAAREEVAGELGSAFALNELDLLTSDYIAAQQGSGARAQAARKLAATARAVNRILARARHQLDQRLNPQQESALGTMTNAVKLSWAAGRVNDQLAALAGDVQAAVAAGEEPDVAAIAATHMPDTGAAGVISELSQLKANIEKASRVLNPDNRPTGSGGVGG